MHAIALCVLDVIYKAGHLQLNLLHTYLHIYYTNGTTDPVLKKLWPGETTREVARQCALTNKTKWTYF